MNKGSGSDFGIFLDPDPGDPKRPDPKHLLELCGVCTTLLKVPYNSVCRNLMYTIVNISVADPDPVGSGLFGSPGSGSGKILDPDPLSTKRPL